MRYLFLVLLFLSCLSPLAAQDDNAGDQPAPPPAAKPAKPAKPANGASRRAQADRTNGDSPGADEPSGGGANSAAEPEIERAPRGWTVHAVSVDAHELLTMFAAQARLPLLVDDTVKRRITVHLANKTSDEILSTIVDAYGFSWAQVDGVHIISEGMPKTPSSYLLSDIASVTTKYVAPAQAKQLLPIFLQQHVMVNTDQNAVVLSGPKPVLDKFREDVAQFDVPATQIMLDVTIVEFTDVNTDNFAAFLAHSNANLGVTTDSLTGQLTLTAIAQLPTLLFSELQALVTQRKARVQASTRVATVSGQSASIFIGQQQYLNTPLNTGADSIDAGVSLNMRPLTGGKGEIILDLSEEISTLSAPDAATGLPTKTTRTASTTVRVRDGQTIVTGGLRQAETRSVHRAIPILGDIPVLGKLFQSHRTENTMVDLAIFITARTLSQTGHLPAEDEQRIKSQFDLEKR